MTTRFFYPFVLVALLVISGCQNDKKPQEEQTEASEETTKAHSSENAMEDTHNSKTSIDWEGVYFGVLPCASCVGTNTLITLNADGTYEKTMEYLESDDVPKTTKGKFSWDEAGQIIIIEENAYLVGENQLFSLDSNHKKMEGNLAENYTLHRTKLELSSDANEGYTLQSFTGSDGKDYSVIFNTNPKIPTAFVKTQGFTKMLSQTQAWAKGAEYSGSKTKLTVRDKKATLIIEDQKTELKQKAEN